MNSCWFIMQFPGATIRLNPPTRFTTQIPERWLELHLIFVAVQKCWGARCFHPLKWIQSLHSRKKKGAASAPSDNTTLTEVNRNFTDATEAERIAILHCFYLVVNISKQTVPQSILSYKTGVPQQDCSCEQSLALAVLSIKVQIYYS